MSEPELYDRGFYASQAPGSARSAAITLGKLFEWIKPTVAGSLRVVDVGCGTGAWLRAARELGATDIIGFDGDHVARENLLIEPGRFIPIRLETESPASLLAGDQRRFDVVLSLEVAEHLPYARSADFVAELTCLGDLVLFSAAVPFQNGTGHINEQWPEFWALLFRAQGYGCFDALRPFLRSHPAVDWWYAQNILLFARNGSGAEALLPAQSRADGRPLSAVHPVNLLVQTLWNHRIHRAAARGIEEADFYSLAAAWSDPAGTPPALRTTAHSAFPAMRTELGDPDTGIAQAHAARALAEGALREAEFRIQALLARCDIAERRPAPPRDVLLRPGQHAGAPPDDQ